MSEISSPIANPTAAPSESPWSAYFDANPEARAALKKAQEADVVFLHINDVYQVDPVGNGADQRGGMANTAGLVKLFEPYQPITTFGGDAFSGGPYSPIFQGEDMVGAFNALDVDYAVPGNHDFDYGIAVTKERLKTSTAVWLCDNLRDAQEQPLVGSHKSVIVEVNGHKIGLVGLVDEWQRVLDRKKLGEYRYVDPVAAAQTAADALAAGEAEIQVALTHAEPAQDRAIAEKTGIDIVLGGHDHRPALETYNEKVVIRPGSDMQNLGVVTVDFRDGLPPEIRAWNLPVTADIPDDEAMAKYVESVHEKTRFLDTAVARTEVELDGRKDRIRNQETNLGNLVADCFREYAGAEIAVVNGGCIRSEKLHPAGELTLFDVYNILNFPDPIVGIEITGEALLKALEGGVGDGGGYPQVSGITFTYDSARPSGSRILNDTVKVGGVPLDPAKTYKVAVPAALAGGRSGYAAFAGAPRYFETPNGMTMKEIFAEFLKAKQVVAPRVENRVTDLAKKEPPK